MALVFARSCEEIPDFTGHRRAFPVEVGEGFIRNKQLGGARVHLGPEQRAAAGRQTARVRFSACRVGVSGPVQQLGHFLACARAVAC